MLNRRKVLKILPGLPLGGLVASGFTGITEKPLTTTDVSSKEPAKALKRSIYNSLGVRPLINARGTVTIIGATRILPEVKVAMDEATKDYVQLDELMDGVGKRLSELTGAEWGCVSSGASAAITLATAGCITGGDPDKLWQIPNLSGLKDEVIVPYYSRTAYECAARAVGVRMIEVSNMDELKAALGPRTAMILVLTGSRSAKGELSLKEISAAAKPHGVPILADAAAEELVVPNPHLQQGADMVAYSGGKCLRGPQCAGLLLGRKDLVQAAWISGAPHHGFGRGQKVGREEIIGMLTAVEMWFKRDHGKEQRTWTNRLEYIVKQIDSIPGVSTEINQPGDRLSNRFPALYVSWDKEVIPLTGWDVEKLLWDDNPGIAVSGAGSFLPFPPNMRPNIRINPSQLNDGEEKIIASRVYKILSNPPNIPRPSGPSAVDVSGQWDVQMKFVASLVDESFVFEQEGEDLVGTHTGSYAKRDLSGTLHGRDILIRSSYTKDGVRLNFEFTGTVKGSDTMQGKVSLGEYGMAEWTAKKRVYRRRR